MFHAGNFGGQREAEGGRVDGQFGVVGGDIHRRQRGGAHGKAEAFGLAIGFVQGEAGQEERIGFAPHRSGMLAECRLESSLAGGLGGVAAHFAIGPGE
jgi:hypothetical protein